ncbi:putative P450 monooxygenase [Xylariales sp. PMI_506]|nr:putative P450 monooxygenase [Xylariales sp. PMI_506]
MAESTLCKCGLRRGSSDDESSDSNRSLRCKGSTIAYNIFYHPLRHFPGPLAARASPWWKVYKEIFQQECIYHALLDLHGRYGEIIRIGPNELHFSNPSAFNDIYGSSIRWDKNEEFYHSFGASRSILGIISYTESKQRKDILQPFFSRRATLKLQKLLRDNMDKLVEAISKNNLNGRPSDLLYAFRCFTVDTIMTVCFGKSMNAIDAPAFQAPIILALDNTIKSMPAVMHFPLLRTIIFSIPPEVSMKLDPKNAALAELQVMLGTQVKEVTSRPEVLSDSPQETIFHRLLDRNSYQEGELPDAQTLYEEAQNMIVAGGLNVGDACMIGHFHVVANPDLYTRLRAEVSSAWPSIHDAPSVEALERLPLLTATIKESLRHSPGASCSLTRVVPIGGATIGGAEVPGGTVVGMSNPQVHMNSDIFAEPERFLPERWFGEKGRALEQWLVPFSRGPRMCLGVNLAWAELYIVFATMIRRFDMRIDGTTREDLAWRDCVLPYFTGRHLHMWCEPVNGKMQMSSKDE